MWLSIFVCEGSRSFYVPGMQHSYELLSLSYLSRILPLLAAILSKVLY